MNSILAKFSLHENLWILETKHDQTIYNHHRNIKWTESYVYTAYSIRFHFIFNEQTEILGYSVNTCCEYCNSGRF
jgi:hypothetical protein